MRDGGTRTITSIRHTISPQKTYMTGRSDDTIIVGTGFGAVYYPIHLRDPGLRCKLIEAGPTLVGLGTGARTQAPGPSRIIQRLDIFANTALPSSPNVSHWFDLQEAHRSVPQSHAPSIGQELGQRRQHSWKEPQSIRLRRGCFGL